MKISKQEFLITQPCYPQEEDADRFYLNIANQLLDSLQQSQACRIIGEAATKQLAITIAGYFQDVVADAGIWRSFCTLCKELYGNSIPLFDKETGDGYIENELNLTDIKFLTWYFLESLSDENGNLAPDNQVVQEAAQLMYPVLENAYDDAPAHPHYAALREIDFEEPDIDMLNDIYDTTYWLFWNSYFMRHAATPVIAESLRQGKEIIAKSKNAEDAKQKLAELNNRTLEENPTGPLSLYAHEWIHMIVDNVSPFKRKKRPAAEPHRFYTQFMKATNGEAIHICPDYNDLNRFLSHEMKWGETEEGQLPQLKNYANFVLYASPEKGLLIAPEVAQYVNLPGNSCYNRNEAAAEAHQLITVRGRCPIDLVKHLFSNALVPDAALPWDKSRTILQHNWDFLARLYLQDYYRAK